MNVLLSFYIHDLKGALFLKANILLLLLAEVVSSTVINPFRTIYASLWSQKFDLSIGASNFMLLLVEN